MARKTLSTSTHSSASWTLEFDPTLALSCIRSCTATSLKAETLASCPALILEAQAQACGLHLRWSHNFTVQAYVLSVRNLHYPEPGVAVGHIQTHVLERTASAWSYAVHLHNQEPGHITLGHAPLPTGDPLQHYFYTRFHALCTPCINASLPSF